jgi:hypothetical protein
MKPTFQSLSSLIGRSVISMGVLILICNERKYKSNEKYHSEILLGCLIAFGIGA